MRPSLAIYPIAAARTCCSAVIISAAHAGGASSAWTVQIGSTVAGATNRLRYLEVTVCRSEVEQAGVRNLGVCARRHAGQRCREPSDIPWYGSHPDELEESVLRKT
jgi:hypothetical protein